MYTLTPAGFCDDQRGIDHYLVLSGRGADPEWEYKQRSSMAEYLEQVQIIPPETKTLYHLFDGFIAAAISGQRGLRILDVGCGIQPDWPIYVSSLQVAQPLTGNVYVGLDPIPYMADKRSYPFICGRMEDLPGKLDGKFDTFIFATSLDHFENVPALASVVKSMASEHATCIFWVGLHDPRIVAEQAGVKVFAGLFQSLRPARFLPKWLMAVAQMLLSYYPQLLLRRSRLLKGRKLDNLHYCYFTEQSVQDYFRLFGDVGLSLRIPGTNSMFAVVRVSSGAS